MKVLYLKNHMHNKNNNALMSYKNITFLIIENADILDTINLEQFDCVYSPATPINVLKYPNIKFLFGPHFSVFPEGHQMDIIRGKNVIYIHPSNWARDVWRNNSLCHNIRIESLPFGVDTQKFSPIKNISDRTNIFIYHKRRDPKELDILQYFLKNLNIHFKIFDYVNRYSEEEYLNYLQESKFGIWLTAHESQGFALEEALSCDVPLLVWNVSSLNQEYGSNYPNLYATTLPYWDNRCGEFFESISELQSTFNTFINKLEDYKPREYILENLSIEKCEKYFIDIVNKI